MFKKIMVANRGEIALRVLRAARELGVKVVVAHSEADSQSLPVLLADEAICIGPPPSAQSYLNIPNLLSAAIISGAEAIHPGYGFLAENPQFAEMCRDHGIVFIGPTPESMHSLGSKAGGREIAAKSNVPTVPGTGVLRSVEEALEAAEQIGYPVLLKASAGGGGRGQKVVRSSEEMKTAFAQAQVEAQNYFSDPSLILEKYIELFRHVEVQVLGDGKGHVVHIGERDCSIQRRNQKLIEEAPSRLEEPLRQEILAAGVRLAKYVNYQGAGTLEFIVDPDGNFYFMEMNTRIQVEHCVSEMISGLDLVKWQIKIAAGEPFTLQQDEIKLQGHAIECRINAEDYEKDFRPSIGKIETLHFPGGPGVRVDSHLYAGYTIPPNYDSLVAKIIVHGENREEAIARMRRALAETVIEGPGVKTTVPFHLKVMDNAFYKRGVVYTNFVSTRMSD
ncbi:acetyl-CoA carboxylase biotin carboxylase subunit [Meiothermus ruber]|jgi:acetyl-CoA carboxylase biotin carboxylase subunit|uniref:Biotin carboxylase n=1 Tax=Meiothermus ruber (strain ATCC 35948 / DSM 1279 / VKM B-1258 / 21) TaxID=504728 RepID=D3PS73_MEIRD|nr:acetyl-CoA carboxylase biotin carboxylase subunit [Meiothermus ruber]GIW39044.1 MAG: acetyl-CoA carboxylase biotin carboxylase subunit [Meiothermus sp.]ADD28306.1 acetyl-CoA carboxylase, biotin carboxylase [Meiothermus ruber DSM 1279]AGK06254.1 acetyl-CoA carboxylase biotin carboxylase [Meiothermus ruber DSM 1279]MCL6529090.1 acetyl-CoA carboxylase biotin carboxylase subunit [Meiothermus ruber]GAO75260.1 acetyl-CoA carboxylase biotin carboxylase [Meiothermus ruber H328]